MKDHGDTKYPFGINGPMGFPEDPGSDKKANHKRSNARQHGYVLEIQCMCLHTIGTIAPRKKSFYIHGACPKKIILKS